MRPTRLPSRCATCRARSGRSLGTLEVAVDRRPGNTELGGDLGHRVQALAVAAGLVVHRLGEPGLPRAELGLLAAGTATGLGSGQARPWSARTSARART